MMGMPIPVPLSLRDVASIWPRYHHPNFSKLDRGSEVRKTFYMSETQVERAISNSKPLFALLMVESNRSEVVKTLHRLAQSLLREFENVFPNGLPSEHPPFRGIKNQIDLPSDAPFPTNRLIGVTLMNQMSYNDKSKSFLIEGTLGRVRVLVWFPLF